MTAILIVKTHCEASIKKILLSLFVNQQFHKHQIRYCRDDQSCEKKKGARFHLELTSENKKPGPQKDR